MTNFASHWTSPSVPLLSTFFSANHCALSFFYKWLHIFYLVPSSHEAGSPPLSSYLASQWSPAKENGSKCFVHSIHPNPHMSQFELLIICGVTWQSVPLALIASTLCWTLKLHCLLSPRSILSQPSRLWGFKLTCSTFLVSSAVVEKRKCQHYSTHICLSCASVPPP